jgi:hypothetical protein
MPFTTPCWSDRLIPTQRWERACALRSCGEPSAATGSRHHPPLDSLSIQDDSEKLGTMHSNSELPIRSNSKRRQTVCPMAKRHAYTI